MDGGERMTDEQAYQARLEQALSVHLGEHERQITERLDKVLSSLSTIIWQLVAFALFLAFFALSARCAPITSNPTTAVYDDCGGWAPSQLKWDGTDTITWWVADCTVGFHSIRLEWEYQDAESITEVSASFIHLPNTNGLYLVDLFIRGDLEVDLGGSVWYLPSNMADVFIPVTVRPKTEIPEPALGVPVALLAGWMMWRRKR